MPFTVTKTHFCYCDGSKHIDAISRQAVATLEEMWRVVDDLRIAAGMSPLDDAIFTTVGESGGTLGPLPDGTVIEVEPREWRVIAREADLLNETYQFLGIDDLVNQRVITAYNAKQATR